MKRISTLSALLALCCTQICAAELPVEARQWAAACKTQPPLRYIEAVGQLVTRMHEERLWDKCGLLLFFAAHEASGEAFNLKGGGTETFSGAVEHQPGRAIKGNGIDASLDTGVHLKDVPGFEVQRHGFYVYVTDDMPGSFTAAGASGGGPAIGVRPRNIAALGLYTGSTTQLTAGRFPPALACAGTRASPRWMAFGSRTSSPASSR